MNYLDSLDGTKIIDYFDSLGFHMPLHRNPADFIFEVSMTSRNDKNEPVDLPALRLDTDAARIAEETVATDITPPDHRFSKSNSHPSISSTLLV